MRQQHSHGNEQHTHHLSDHATNPLVMHNPDAWVPEAAPESMWPGCRHRTKYQTEHGFSRCVECKETFPDPPAFPVEWRLTDEQRQAAILAEPEEYLGYTVLQRVVRAAEDHLAAYYEAEVARAYDEGAEWACAKYQPLLEETRGQVAQLQEQLAAAIAATEPQC